MQQDNNHIEDNLRQLENQQLPDLSNMDKHWQQMEQMLAAEAKPKVAKTRSFFTFYGRRLFLAAAIITFVFAAWFFKYAQTNTAKNNIGSVVKTTADPKKGNQDDTQKTVAANLQQRDQSSSQKSDAHLKDDNIMNVVDNRSLTPDSLAPGNDIVETEAQREERITQMMSTFYSRIQKPIQEFDINAQEGGVITCNEGTVLTIPPLAFLDQDGKIISGEVMVMVEEFYKYSDMIAANLTTTSGGKQLLTGGMIKVTATANGSDINLRVSKEINVAMPTTTYDPEMKLFTSDAESGEKLEANTFATYAVQKRNLDWDLNGPQDIFPVFDGKTNFPQKLDQPYNVIKTGKKRIGKFALSDKSPLTTDEMKKILEEKYGDYYDIIRVKRESDPGRSATFLYRGKVDKENVIGDSSRMTLEQALRSRCIEKKDIGLYLEKIKADSILYIKRFIASRLLNPLPMEQRIPAKESYQAVYNNTKSISLDSLDRIYNEYVRRQKAYSFSMKKMGWINCDKFSNCSNKTNFIINLPQDVKADKFVSQVVFISTHSVMPGRTLNNQIGFHNIPADMGVYVVGLGERNGKVVSFMQKLKVGRSEVNISDLQETTPEAFRKKIAELDIN